MMVRGWHGLLLAAVLAGAPAGFAGIPEPPYDTDELLNLAERHNPRLAAARAQEGAGAGRVRAAREYPNPTLEVLADDLAEDRGRFEGRMVQPLVVGPRRDAARRLAQSELEAARWRTEMVRHEVYAAVREAELEALYNRALLNLGIELAQLAEDLAAEAQRRGDEDAARRFALEAELVRQLVLNGATGFADALQRLRALIPGVAIEGDALGSPFIYEPIGREFAVSLQAAVLQHPGLQAAEAGVRAADHAVRLARAERLPDVGAILGGGYDQSVEEGYVLVGVSVEIPVFSRQKGRILEALAALERAGHERDALAAELAVELVRERQLLSEMDTLALDARDLLVPLAVRIFEEARRSAAAGHGATIDLLDAYRALVAARRSELRYLFEASRSRARVLHFLQEMPKLPGGKPGFNEAP